MPPADAPVSDRIQDDPKVKAAFKDVIGALDGTHLPAHPPAAERSRFRDRKGNVSFNVMAGCSFDLLFQFVIAGWEGSASDSCVLGKALATTLKIPQGRAYLGDAGFALSKNVMVPYRGTRYHLKEWATGNAKPRTAKELYNRRHAGLRSVIERIFGIMKERFKVLVLGSDFPLKVQVSIFPALAVVHNFIRTVDPDDVMSDPEIDAWIAAHCDSSSGATEGEPTFKHDKGAEESRTLRAQLMWTAYNS
ncbi:hypothetical protein A4X06_0g1800 [Tilletia controversa]|uniref:DDE Tnp4 domain-containing protein n=1 Tax=Tilletia controversa TaxID=13291 RepID=A0A8X7MWX0_9BASI|nr:hypothetical protein A4X06_0g1800 [Tilletia controversa]